MDDARQPSSYEFGAYRLEPTERLLLRDGQPVPLTPKAFDLLVYLVEHHGHLVEKTTLMAALWPDTIVEEANLSFQVSALRRALGDGGNGEQMIQTVPTKGYRFVGDVMRRTAIAPAPGDGAVLSPSPGLSHRRIAAGVVSLLVVAIAVGSLLTWRNSGRAPGTAATTQVPLRLVTITTLTGWQEWPSLSPDGEQIAFEWGGEKDDNYDIYVTIMGSPDARRLTTDPAPDFAPTWSPNGREIAFLRAGSGISSQIRLMSALGGPDRAVNDFPAWASITWSPDGNFIAAGRLTDHDPNRGIYLVPTSGGTARPIVPARAPLQALAPAFSPDGHRLAYAACERVDYSDGDPENAERGAAHGCHVMLADVDETYTPRGTPRRLTTMALDSVGALAWSPDGRTVVFSGYVPMPRGEPPDDFDQYLEHLWRVPVDGPLAPELVELAGVYAHHATMSRSRDRLVFSRASDNWDVYRFSLGGTSERFVSSARFDGHAQFSDDGRRIAFASSRTGPMEIWVANADGTEQRQLTRGPTVYQGSPRWSPDGTTVAFDALEANGDRHIWTIPAEGGAPRQLTAMPGKQAVPTWSHDGQWIYFSNGEHRRRDIWRVPSAGGRSEQISSTGSGHVAFESADARHIIYKLGESDAPLAEVSISGGTPKTVVECVTAGVWGFSVRGDAIYYQPCRAARRGVIRVLDRKTGKDSVWAVAPDGANLWLADLPISPDGRTLLYSSLPTSVRQLWMLENFR